LHIQIFIFDEFFRAKIKNYLASEMSTKKQSKAISHLEKLNELFEGKQYLVLAMSLILTTLFGLLLFEPKVSIGGDDSMYINRAYNFINKGSFPTFQAPLYPIFLGLIIYVAGTKLLLFKVISMLCYLGHQWFTFKLFRNYFQPFALFVFFLLISTSAALLFYSCSTYNEVFFLLLQSIFLYHFARSFINDEGGFSLKRDYKNILISGFLALLLALTKNIGLVGAMGAVMYFLFVKNWKMSAAIAITFIVFLVSFNTIKSTIWEVEGTQISGQLDALMLKVPYKPDSGKEDAYGFITRLVDNSKVYLGYHFRNIFGLAKDDKIAEHGLMTLIIYAIFIPGFFISLRKSRFWLFIGVYTSVAFGTTFLILQTFWDQERLIIVFAPLLLAFLLYTLNYLFAEKYAKYSNVLVALFVIIMGANLVRSFIKIPKQVEIVSAYVSGDKYYGFPEDWIYYLQMAEWVGKNLPKDSYVACRKPGMAFVYSGGKDFFGIWNVPKGDAEFLYTRLKDAGVTHVIMANLRTNPDDENSRIINTVRRYLSAINQAYPGKLKLVHEIGEKWPTYLYELN
jgi:hypothetical protein